MDYNKRPYFYGTGRRKKSVARVRLYNGTGNVTINGRDINDYFGLETLKVIVRQPLQLTSLRCRRRCYRSGGRHPPRYCPCAVAVQQRRTASAAQEGRVPDPRPENEGA